MHSYNFRTIQSRSGSKKRLLRCEYRVTPRGRYFVRERVLFRQFLNFQSLGISTCWGGIVNSLNHARFNRCNSQPDTIYINIFNISLPNDWLIDWAPRWDIPRWFRSSSLLTFDRAQDLSQLRVFADLCFFRNLCQGREFIPSFVIHLELIAILVEELDKENTI